MATIKQFRRRAATITTSDATPTVICSIDVEALSVGSFAFRVTAKNPTTGDLMYSCMKEGIYTRGVTVMSFPTAPVAIQEFLNSLLGTLGVSTSGATVAINGGALQVKVAGKAGTQVQWRCNLWVFPN